MKTLKKNNKGFSLVELIVVILIMAIIAVALAPQVMKWVDESKKSADQNAMAMLKSTADAAIADYRAQGNPKLTATIYFDENGPKLTSDKSDYSGTTFGAILVDTMNCAAGKYPVPEQDNTKLFKLTITNDKVVVTDDFERPAP